MKRRAFLAAGATLPLAACDWLYPRPPVTIHRPGMREGHLLRDGATLPPPSGELRCGIAILGSGVAGISAAWQLWRGGYRDFVLIDGPEPFGNAAGMQLGGVPCPTGAHYLPLPTRESTHVREMLADIGVLRAGLHDEAPLYDEQALLHPAHERLRIGERWQEDFLPLTGEHGSEHARFLQQMAGFREAIGSDGRRAFAIPHVLSSQDKQWRDLDKLDFQRWLQQQGYRSPHLHWYTDYCCRDDYGAGAAQVSAWAGVHYFASRNGRAANGGEASLLTWPDGLQTPLTALRARIPFGNDAGAPRALSGFATRVEEGRSGVRVELARFDGNNLRSLTLQAGHVICAMPLHVAQRVVRGMPPATPSPNAAWLVGNFLLSRFPQESEAMPLAWDNVLQDSRSLGYVVATHQWIRVAKPERTVFTTYHALEGSPQVARKWLQTATESELLRLAASDLRAVYGERLWKDIEAVHISLRGHAMSIPSPGSLDRADLLALRQAAGRLRFAHGNLSGFSIFEESAWWGVQAATSLL